MGMTNRLSQPRKDFARRPAVVFSSFSNFD
jgi:hypothetical protein